MYGSIRLGLEACQDLMQRREQVPSNARPYSESVIRQMATHVLSEQYDRQIRHSVMSPSDAVRRRPACAAQHSLRHKSDVHTSGLVSLTEPTMERWGCIGDAKG